MTEDVLAALEEENEIQDEEPVWIPDVPYDPALAIAGILQTRQRRHIELRRLPGANLGADLAVQYLVENLSADQVRPYLQRPDGETIAKLILIDLAVSLLPRKEYPPQSLESLVGSIAQDVHSDMFPLLYQQLLRGPQKAQIEEKKEVLAVLPLAQEQQANVFQYYRGKNMQTAIAVAQIMPYLEGVEERVATIRSVKELKQVIAGNIYLGIMRNEDTKQQIRDYLAEPQYAPQLFLSCNLYLVQDVYRSLMR